MPSTSDSTSASTPEPGPKHRAEELPAVMALLHGRGVRGYVTLNTLIFSDELESLEKPSARSQPPQSTPC